MKNKKSLVKKYKSGGTQMPFTLPAVYNPYYGVSEYGDGGRVWKDIGAGAYGAGEGLLDTMTMGATDQLTDMGYKALQKAGNSTEDEIRQQNSIAGYGKAAGAITGAVTGLVTPEAAIGTAAQGIGQGISYGSASDPNAQMAGSMVTSLGKLGSMAAGQGIGSAGVPGGSNANMLTMINPNMNTGVPNTMSPQQVGMMAKYGGMKYSLGGVIKTPYDNKIAITDIRMFANGGLSSGMQRVWDNPNKKPLFVNSLQMFKNGGQIVAELEGGENYIKASDGGFVQLPDSAPSHEEGGVKLTEQQIPSGSIIFSDKLKVPGTNKTFAEMNKKNDTSKLDKKFDKMPSNQAAINAKEELKKAMMINSQNLFAQQESLKQEKVKNYAKRLGLVPSRDNENTEPMGLPEGNEGEYAMARMGGMYMAGGQMMVPTVNDYMRDEDYNSLTYANGGRLPEGLLRSRLEAHMSPEEASNYIANYANGGMIKRADGSYSQRGLWDNIRANAGSGKQPTKEMLEQEAKINAKYEKGGIHINPANKGKFTASAERAGMGVQEFARHVLANSEDYSSTQVKRANFARNAAGWKHEMGGVQQYNMGGNTGEPMSEADYKALQNINKTLYNSSKYKENWMDPKFTNAVAEYSRITGVNPTPIEGVYAKSATDAPNTIYNAKFPAPSNITYQDYISSLRKTQTPVVNTVIEPKGTVMHPDYQGYSIPGIKDSYNQAKQKAQILNYGTTNIANEAISQKRHGGINYNNESIIQYVTGGVNGEDPNNPNIGAIMTDEFNNQILSNLYYNPNKEYYQDENHHPNADELAFDAYDPARFADNYEYPDTIPESVPTSIVDFSKVTDPNIGASPLNKRQTKKFNKSLNKGLEEYNKGNTGFDENGQFKKDYSNFADVGTQVGMGLLQNAGNIYDIYRGSKPETETYERYTPTTLTADEVLRGNQLGYAAGKQGLAASSQGSGSAYRQNLKDLALKKMYADAKAIENVNNLNAGIRNQAGMFNTELAKQEVIANLQNKAKARDLIGSGISETGKNVSSQIKGYKTGKMDAKTLQAIIASNPQWANSAEGKDYIAQFKR